MLAKVRTKLECAFDFNAIRKLLNLTPAAPWRTKPTSRLRGVWNPRANEEPHVFNMYRNHAPHKFHRHLTSRRDVSLPNHPNAHSNETLPTSCPPLFQQPSA